ncbi:protein lin-37 homolog isoform X2 [Myxocyprinus asiaticus]|uniref:protein lin-37 homolog isoform X2 n=1 Tax=Myxocyprinus asiaticus TaxID=70543 RepID=UPI002221AD54|nr:protein lin-37 homolog isoform X2 [Myxocyprinus asiaticus]XP_051521993.1 protein lin-37 homolog isoform X2 [Myxocyprinus asiaticus]
MKVKEEDPCIMLHCKIKTEKTDAGTPGARNCLDAVLQVLVDSEREQNEEDSGKIVVDSSSKYLSPSSVEKRPSSRFPQHRRKKRKEMDDSLAETNQHKQNVYIIKLFDHSVDLAQFGTTILLYPICRAWMRNNPAVRERNAPSPPHSSGEDEMTDMLNGKGQNVYRLPPPVSCSFNSAGEPVSLRIPPVVKPAESQVEGGLQ